MSESADRSIGSILRERRLELGVSFEEIVTRTRIRRAYLEALEADRFEAFPGDAYLKGYLKGYAEALELDPQPLLQAYARLSPPTPTPTPLETAGLPAVDSRSARPAARLGKWAVLAAVLAALVLGWLLWAPRPSGPPKVAVPASEPASPMEQGPAEVVAPGPTAAPAAPEAAATPSPGEPAAAAPEGAMPAPADPAAAPQSALPPPESPAAESESVAAAPLPANQVGVLRLQATGPGQLELTIDGRPAQRYTLQANTILSWKVSRSARIYLENPSSVRLWLEGREIDPAGRNQLVLQPGEEKGQ